ncbi:hypothetical protein NRC85_003994 [Vibrio parahaemolyticus]|nr:hypothetical protein [Vibrio parahaemolyticus]
MLILETLSQILNNSTISNNALEYGTKLNIDLDCMTAIKYKDAEFVFLDRDFGSFLFPIGEGVAPSWLEAYKDYNRAAWYHVKPNGQYRRITSGEAVRLANIAPSLNGLSKFAKMKRLVRILNNVDVTSSGFTKCRLSPRSSLCELKRWFDMSGNVVMQKLVNNL